MDRSFRYNVLDVFTDTPLTGNPLAVFTKGKGLSDLQMQSIAREMNLSETVFLLPPQQGGHARLRIFTPYVELPFAGHPVLGAAWILGQPMELPQLNLETGAGKIQLEMTREGGRLALGRMEQPLPSFEEFQMSTEVYQALGFTGATSELLQVVEVRNGPAHLLVELPSQNHVDQLRPDHYRLAQLVPHAGVYAFAHEGSCCFARCFAPGLGIHEDPATGSAAGPLGAYLVKSGRLQSGAQLTVAQGEVMGRPSTLYVTAHLEEGAITAVSVAGRAIVIARGELMI